MAVCALTGKRSPTCGQLSFDKSINSGLLLGQILGASDESRDAERKQLRTDMRYLSRLTFLIRSTVFKNQNLNLTVIRQTP